MRGQAGGVGQEHAEGYFVAAGIFCGIGGEFGDDGGDWGIEIEEATFVEEHCHGRGGYNFCEGA